MKITKRQLKRIIKEEAQKLKEVEYYDGTDSFGGSKPHYAHQDIAMDFQEVLDRWIDASPAQWRLAFEDAVKGMN
tara:strand:- start:54 stop:278 length:225 start_codon:yes stop_codon:yes gene_type:complete